MIKSKVELAISRTISNVEKDYISLRIRDDTSGVQIVQVKIPLDKFSQVITGLVVGNMEAEFGNLELVGKTLEIKTRNVKYNVNKIETYSELWPSYIMNCAKQYEVDGWKADKVSGYNDRHNSPNGYSIIFRKWTT